MAESGETMLSQMHKITLRAEQIRLKVRLTDPLFKMLEWDVEKLIALRARNELPAPILLADGSNFLVIDGNHRTRIAWDEGWSLEYCVVDSDDDLRRLVRDDVRDGLPTTISEAIQVLRRAALEHDNQWSNDYSY